MFSGSDVKIVVREALMEPIRALRIATHFKKEAGIHPVCCSKTPRILSIRLRPCCAAESARPVGAQETGVMVADMHVACSPGAAGAMAMTLHEVPSEKLQEPIMTVDDFVAVLGNARPTVSEADLEPYVKWTEEYGSEGGAVPGGGNTESSGIDPAASQANPAADGGIGMLGKLLQANNKLTAVMAAILENNGQLAARVAQLEAGAGGGGVGGSAGAGNGGGGAGADRGSALLAPAPAPALLQSYPAAPPSAPPPGYGAPPPGYGAGPSVALPQYGQPQYQSAQTGYGASHPGVPPMGALPPSGGSGGSPPVDPALEARLRALRGD